MSSHTIGDEKLSALEQAEETLERVTMGQVHSSNVDITNDLNAAKVAAMKAAELGILNIHFKPGPISIFLFLI